MIDLITCGRCGKSIPADEDEACWFCMGALCYRCWDQYGHCGHPEADKINELVKNGVFHDPLQVMTRKV